MLEKQLSDNQIKEIEKIRHEWKKEVQPYLEAQPKTPNMLDGEVSSALARIQEKYKARIKNVINRLQMDNPDAIE